MAWIPGTYGFQTEQDYRNEVARKQAAGVPLTKPYIPPAPAPPPAAPKSATTGSGMTAAQKAASLGTITTPQGTQMSAADWLSDPGMWSDSGAYQNYMSGTQDIKPPTEEKEENKPIVYNYYTGSQGGGSNQYDQQVANLVSQLQNAINNMPTVESIMNSPAYQQMQQAIQAQQQQAMKSARADLAARGVLGEGSTPAVERMGQVAGHYGQQLGALVPSMLGTAQQMHGAKTSALQNLVGLLSGLDQQNWQRGITEFQTQAPYYRMTAGERANLAQWIINSFPQMSGYSPQEIEQWLMGVM